MMWQPLDMNKAMPYYGVIPGVPYKMHAQVRQYEYNLVASRINNCLHRRILTRKEAFELMKMLKKCTNRADIELVQAVLTVKTLEYECARQNWKRPG